MSTNGEFEALFVNDPDEDYALTMELSHAGEVIAIVRQDLGTLVVDFYPPSTPIRMPLDWLIKRLQTAQTDLSKEGTQAETL